MSLPDYNLQDLHVETLNPGEPGSDLVFIWAHGWGQTSQAMAPMAQSLFALGQHVALDFPGFGRSPKPADDWGTAEYADFAAAFLETLNIGDRKVIWIGHSFGCRVGLQLAARRPDLVNRLFLIAAAGLQRNRSLIEQAKVTSKIYAFKGLKRVAPMVGVSVDDLRSKFGSADYQSAGEMRQIFLNVVREDLTDIVGTIRCPVELVFGSKDTETPPEIGRRLEQLIPNARLTVLDGQDHYTVIGTARHQVARRLRDFVKEA